MAKYLNSTQVAILMDRSSQIVTALSEQGQLNQDAPSEHMSDIIAAQEKTVQSLLAAITALKTYPEEYHHYSNIIQPAINLDRLYHSIRYREGQGAINIITESPEFAAAVEDIRKAERATQVREMDEATHTLQRGVKHLKSLDKRATDLASEIDQSFNERRDVDGNYIDSETAIIKEKNNYQETGYNGDDFAAGLEQSCRILAAAARCLGDVTAALEHTPHMLRDRVTSLQYELTVGAIDISKKSPKTPRVNQAILLLHDINDALVDAFIDDFMKQALLAKRTGSKPAYKIRTKDSENDTDQSVEPEKTVSGVDRIKHIAQTCLDEVEQDDKAELDADMHSKLQAVIDCPDDPKEFTRRVKELNQQMFRSAINMEAGGKDPYRYTAKMQCDLVQLLMENMTKRVEIEQQMLQ